MKKAKHLILALPVFFLLSACDTGTKSAKALAERIIGEKSASIRFETLKGEQKDVYEIETVRNRVVIRGNNANSMAMGLNRYLQEYCLAQVSWYDYNPVELPETLPPVPEKVRVESLLPYRFFLNYCTYGYTLPFWNWNQWERFIDWMALNGVNMPLATTGQEAVWQKVWRRFGMTDEQIRSYFTGPAHLPWHQMNNINHWQSPLPQEWIDAHAELQRKIVARERELGMHPVLPGFNGRIPGDLAQSLGTELRTFKTSWCGFDEEFNCTLLNPMDPHFAAIQKVFIEEQTAMYGSDHIYSVDAFNELDLPASDAATMATISKGIYESLENADPEAKWLQMGWMFLASIWTPETIDAYLSAVPKGRLIMLDYCCDARSLWRRLDCFSGQDFIWCYLGNFGGATAIEGNIHTNSKNLDEVFADGGPSFKGVGSTLEGFGVNEPLYEHVMSRAWDTGKDVDEYIDNIADRRLGRVDGQYRAFWHHMDEHVRIQHEFVDHASIFTARPRFGFDIGWKNGDARGHGYDPEELEKAEDILNTVRGESNALAFDRANTRRQVLDNMATPALNRFEEAYKAADRDGMVAAKDNFLALMDSLTAVLRSRPEFSMDRWVGDARSWGVTEEQKDYYEMNARTLITVWGSSLLDYAARDFDGLVEEYYKPRWQMFFDEVMKAFDEKRPVADLSDRFWEFECSFAGIE
ncbi:MAG: alpha-N-acetylglucosaminidase [Bacteroidales bacterium]|nr:alpha-N-acetylglucosaminidase [Bacteroidales bacterium]